MQRSVKSLRIPRFGRFSTVQLLIALGLFFIWAPFVEEIEGGELIVSALFSLVLLAGVVAVADSKRVLVIAIVEANQAAQRAAGHWGVPMMVFGAEPFARRPRTQSLSCASGISQPRRSFSNRSGLVPLSGCGSTP